MHKVITFGIPSYNAAKDMDHCITSILEGSNYATDIEIIVVDDGSKDETAAKHILTTHTELPIITI